MDVNLDFVRYLDREGKLYCHFLALVPIADGKARHHSSCCYGGCDKEGDPYSSHLWFRD